MDWWWKTEEVAMAWGECFFIGCIIKVDCVNNIYVLFVLCYKYAFCMKVSDDTYWYTYIFINLDGTILVSFFLLITFFMWLH